MAGGEGLWPCDGLGPGWAPAGERAACRAPECRDSSGQGQLGQRTGTLRGVSLAAGCQAPRGWVGSEQA